MKTMQPWLRAVLDGVLTLALLCLLTALCAKLIEGGRLPVEGMPAISYGILAVSALAGCLITGRTCRQGKLLWTLLTAAVSFLLLCVMNGVLLRGEFQRLLPTAGVIFGAAMLAALLSAKGKRDPFG